MTVPRLQMDEANQAVGPYHDGTHKIIDRLLYNRQMAAYARSSGTVLDLVNMAGITNTPVGTASNVDDSVGPWVRWTSATTAAADAGPVFAAVTAFARASWSAEFRANIKLGSNLLNCRYLAGLYSADPRSSADPVASAAAFRYDTTADGTAFWRTYSNDGTTTGLANALTAGIQGGVGAIVASRAYDLRIKIEALGGNAPNKIMYYINDLLVFMHASELPAATAYLMPWVICRHIASGGSANTLDINQIIYNSQPIA